MNSDLEKLQAYPFERLAALKAQLTPPAGLPHIALSIGEPKHEPPAFVIETLRRHLHELDSYPATRGLPELKAAAAQWATRRFALPAHWLDAESMILPVTGTREALFAFVQATVSRQPDPPVVVMPNPCYQIYEGAALLAGAEPYYLNTTCENDYLPDLDAVPEAIWHRCQLLFLCSPGNPVGSVMNLAYLQRALALAERYDFVIASDECYADLYDDEATPPPSLLTAAAQAGRGSLARCMSFHSLSKRSSLPGLRSGVVIGDPGLINPFLLYRTYHGCAMSIPTQKASAAAWADDEHVRHNRQLYRQKFDRVLPILREVFPDVARPAGGFYVWLRVGGDDEAFAARLFAEQNITVVPGRYLGRDTTQGNPGKGYVRLSLVASESECVAAAMRIRAMLRK